MSFSIYFRSFESGIAPTANSSWTMGFGVDSHTTQEVLDPISSSLDRVIHNSGARVSSLSLSLYSAVGLEVSLTLPLCEELPLGAEAHHGPTQLHAG